MKSKFMKFLRPIVIMLICIIALPCLALTLSAFDINLPNETSNAIRKWKEADIRNYEVHYHFGSFSYVGDVYITVENNQIKDIQGNDLTSIDSIPISPLPDWYTYSFGSDEILPPDLNHYTVDGLLEWWAEKDKQIDQPIIQMCDSEQGYNVNFNPQLGYIEKLVYTCNQYDFGLGLLCPAISHCTLGLSIVGFEILNTAD